MAQRLVTPTRLQRYLQAQPELDSTAGIPADCYGCIIARWLRHELDEHDGNIWVGETAWYDAQERRHVLPRWAQDFIRLGDRQARAQGCPLTVGEALALVDRLGA